MLRVQFMQNTFLSGTIVTVVLRKEEREEYRSSYWASMQNLALTKFLDELFTSTVIVYVL